MQPRSANWPSPPKRHGWDGLFVWEPVWGVDAWVSLAVAAMPHSHDPSRHDAHTAAPAQAVGARRSGGHGRPAVRRPGRARPSASARRAPATRSSARSPTARFVPSCSTRAWRSSRGCGTASRSGSDGVHYEIEPTDLPDDRPHHQQPRRADLVRRGARIGTVDGASARVRRADPAGRRRRRRDRSRGSARSRSCSSLHRRAAARRIDVDRSRARTASTPPRAWAGCRRHVVARVAVARGQRSRRDRCDDDRIRVGPPALT